MDIRGKLTIFLRRGDNSHVPHRKGIQPKPYTHHFKYALNGYTIEAGWKPSMSYIKIFHHDEPIGKMTLVNATLAEFNQECQLAMNIVQGRA